MSRDIIILHFYGRIPTSIYLKVKVIEVATGIFGDGKSVLMGSIKNLKIEKFSEKDDDGFYFITLIELNYPSLINSDLRQFKFYMNGRIIFKR